MIKNYIKIALRNLQRHKAFSLINILGLAVGMTCSILILLWVTDELSYDRFNTRATNIYRVTLSMETIQAAVTPAPLAQAMKDQIPQVENSVLTTSIYEGLISVGDRKFKEPRIIFADTSFFSIFSYSFVKGNPKTCLNRPDGIVLTEAMAKKYFGNDEPIGKTIRHNNSTDFTVVAVIKNVPSAAHLQFDFVGPISAVAKEDKSIREAQWGNFNFFTFVLVKDNANSEADIREIEKKINVMYSKKEPDMKANFVMQPLTDIHLKSKMIADVSGQGDIQYVRIFSIVAIFILLVACINFMNLATARSAQRAKEVGLRKVIGARRSHLIAQFLGESAIITGLALVIAMLLSYLLLPAFNHIADKHLSIEILDVKVILMLVGTALLTGLISGTYPALFLSGFQPVKVLKGQLRSGKGASIFRNGLVVVQFVVSILLLVGTAVVFQQIDFIRNRNLGFDKNNLVYFDMTGDLWKNRQAMMTELESNQVTKEVTFCEQLPTNLTSGTVAVEWEGYNKDNQPIFYNMAVQENFIHVFGMTLLDGRDFIKDNKADSSSYILNETSVKLMGMEVSNAVGRKFKMWGKEGTIIGVVKNFNFKPVQTAVEPVIIRRNTWGGRVVVRTAPGEAEAAIKVIEDMHRKLNPDYPFSYAFVDEDLNRMYKGEQQMSTVFNIFAGIAIFISCLGLYGLSAFTAEQRTKEIGVRKALGASVLDIVYLLTANFTRLVWLAMIIAVPLGWYFMNQWLKGFAYHVNVGWLVLATACIAALVIAVITVSYESVRAGVGNPVNALKSE